MHDVPLDEVLVQAGFTTTQGKAMAIDALCKAGLTNTRKTRITEHKIPLVADELERRIWHCKACICVALPMSKEEERGMIEVPLQDCKICQGGNNRRAIARAAVALRSRKIAKVLVVGGVGANHRELANMDNVEFRFVDGMSGIPTKARAEADKDWADLVIIWASTPLPHKISLMYTRGMKRTIIVPRRGITSLCEALAKEGKAK